MNKIKAAIIEDEIPAARLLNKMLTELRPEWEILLLPGNVEGAVKWFNSNPHPDILFLDIQLTDGVSFSFIERNTSRKGTSESFVYIAISAKEIIFSLP